MLCKACGVELAKDAKFCSNCGTPVPKPAGLQVEQKVDNIKGDVAGLVAGAGATTAGLNANVKQDVGTVASGGTVTGAILGSKDSHIHVGEERNPPRDSL